MAASRSAGRASPRAIIWRRCRSRRCRRSSEPYGIIVTGVGGTGIVTIGGVLGMAAHLEGKGVGIIDMAGLAQKGGAVYSHIRIANKPEDIHAIRDRGAAAPISCSAATSWSPATRRCWRR